jgi:uncharacterized membrane protein
MSQSTPYTGMPGSFGPPAEVRRSNILGIVGFVLSLGGLLLCCVPPVSLISVLGLIISFIALFRSPRGFAIAGVLLGVLGSVLAIIALIVTLVFSAVGWGIGGIQQLNNVMKVQQSVEQYRAANNGAWPTEIAQLGLPPEVLSDRWGTPYRFEFDPATGAYELLSAGEDRQFDTTDDIDIAALLRKWGVHPPSPPTSPLPPVQTPPAPPAPSTPKPPSKGPV